MRPHAEPLGVSKEPSPHRHGTIEAQRDEEAVELAIQGRRQGLISLRYERDGVERLGRDARRLGREQARAYAVEDDVREARAAGGELGEEVESGKQQEGVGTVLEMAT